MLIDYSNLHLIMDCRWTGPFEKLYLYSINNLLATMAFNESHLTNAFERAMLRLFESYYFLRSFNWLWIWFRETLKIWKPCCRYSLTWSRSMVIWCLSLPGVVVVFTGGLLLIAAVLILSVFGYRTFRKRTDNAATLL